MKTQEPDFTELYTKAFPAVAAFVAKMGGDMDLARDIFQDALIIYYEQVFTAGQKPERSPEAYLYGISRHLWHRETRTASRHTPLQDAPKVTEESEQPSAHKLMLLLQTAGQKCLDLLQGFYYQKQSIQEIQQEFGYSSVRSATVQKFKCLEKVRSEVQQKSLQYEDFLA
tara:strand:- start:593 stop:1102 length:510 start_codon:yes stop_codon:yes gene_type:complete